MNIRSFAQKIEAFNAMYGLPVALYPSLDKQAIHETTRITRDASVTFHRDPIRSRLEMFRNILLEEVNEIEDIFLSMRFGVRYYKGQRVTPEVPYTEIEFLVDQADWLGDIQVYCASEMARYGLPLDETLAIIMASNFSKLGEDGQPIYDSRGKVQKGPGYWKPEPQIKAMLLEKIMEHTKMPKDEAETRAIVWR